jgi:HSP20 family molecular chaperone IbpA
MKFIAPALVALAVPTATAYSLGVLPNGLFTLSRGAAAPCRQGVCGPSGASLMMPDDIRMMQRRRNQLFKRAFQPNAPRYQVVDNDEIFSVEIDVPGVKAEDLKINLEEDGKMLTLSGSREKTEDGYSYSSEFSESFYIDPAVIDTEHFSANLQNGVLVVSAPKDLKKLAETVKSIPITELPAEPFQVKGEAAAVDTEADASSAPVVDVPVSTSNEETIDLDAPAESDEKA